jgi:pimeloyl-ACP methyl ester carboxylesterase
MSETQQQKVKVNGIELNVHIAGPESGPPVWLLHGFPECWHSWREQIPALVAQGYRVFVPEMRGYGQSSAPPEVADYDLLTLCADIQGAMDLFGHCRVVMIGHDWGAVVAWHLALLEPERVSQLVTMSVPFAGRSRRPVIEIMRELYADRFNYILYFQAPGVAEKELDADIERTLRLFMQDQDVFLQKKPASAKLLEGVPLPGRRVRSPHPQAHARRRAEPATKRPGQLRPLDSERAGAQGQRTAARVSRANVNVAPRPGTSIRRIS